MARGPDCRRVAGAVSLGRGIQWVHGTRLFIPVTSTLIDDGWGLVICASGTAVLFAVGVIHAFRRARAGNARADRGLMRPR